MTSLLSHAANLPRPTARAVTIITRETGRVRLSLPPACTSVMPAPGKTLPPPGLASPPDRLDQPVPFGTYNAVELQRRADVDIF